MQKLNIYFPNILLRKVSEMCQKKKKVNPIDKQSKEKPQDDNWEQLIQTRAY